MQISVDNRTKTIERSLEIDLKQLLDQTFNAVHPSITFGKVKLTSNSFLLALGKNAVVQAKAVIDRNIDMITGVRVHQIEGYTEEKLEDFSSDVLELPHPVPNESTFMETRQTLDILANLDPSIDIHVLISGGGSAAFALPEEGIDVKSYLEILRLAIAAGYDIHELNLIRSLIDVVKGGKLASRLADHRIFGWVVSDVLDDDPRIIASGPLSPGIKHDISITNWLNRLFSSLNLDINVEKLISNLPSTGIPNVSIELVLTRAELIRNLQDYLSNSSYDLFVADTNLEGTVIEVSQQITQLLNQFSSFSDRVILWSGEPTITLSSHALSEGKGGRISALCVYLAEIIQEYDDVVFLGLATDGKDGSSAASGYLIDSKTYDQIENMGSPDRIIKSGNSGLALTSTYHGIYLKNTDVNLLDLYLLIIN